ncbi:MAG TPA: hypothetical protein PKL04_11555 [Methanofastidiosum sp.]|jgi:hypothetical protein|nr:hypothetical protein [Methanofastidiosum sp.]
MPLLEEIQKETVDSNSDLGALPPIFKELQRVVEDGQNNGFFDKMIQ